MPGHGLLYLSKDVVGEEKRGEKGIAAAEIMYMNVCNGCASEEYPSRRCLSFHATSRLRPSRYRRVMVVVWLEET